MRVSTLSGKRFYLVPVFILVAVGLVWAAVELAAALGLMTQDTGSNAADLEMLSLRTILKPGRTADSPQPPPCDWRMEAQLRQALEENNQAYMALCRQANGEVEQAGDVSSGTQRQIMSTAKAFGKLCRQYADLWRGCGMTARADLVQAVGLARERSAGYAALKTQMRANGNLIKAYAGRLESMTDAQDRMMSARRIYAIKAIDGRELDSAQQKQAAALIPEIDRLIERLLKEAERAHELQKEVQRQLGGGGDPEWGYPKLAAGLKTATDKMLNNARELKADAMGLSGGTKPRVMAAPRMDSLGAPCFLEALIP